MIASYEDEDTERFAMGVRVRRFVPFERVALRKIRQLQVCASLDDLRVPPGNRLEALKGVVPVNIASVLTSAIGSVLSGDRRWLGMSKSSIITSDETSSDLLSPVTPGELLKEEFLVPMGISQYRLAKETGIPAQRIGQIVLGKRRVTADTDLRLCRYFGLTDGYWLRAQVAFDLEAEKRRIEPELDKIVPVQQAVAL